MEDRNGIVLAMFGTSVAKALPGLTNIRDLVVEQFPETPVRIAFTSKIIRRIWQKRAEDPDYLHAHPDIPADILHVQGTLAAIANLQDEGIDSIVVQPIHIAPAEEFFDLASYVEGLNSINTVKAKQQPFTRLVLGRPALGTYGTEYPYSRDLVSAAETLSDDAGLAEQDNTALVYMGHGNRYFPSSGVYLEFAAEMRRQYPGTLTVMATLEGFPTIDDAISLLRDNEIEQVILKPFMVAAGRHALDDMIGDKSESLKNRLEEGGFSVRPVVQGLGEQDDFAGIFVQHIKDAASDAGIRLR